MKKHTSICISFLTFIFCIAAKGQSKTDFPEDNIKAGHIYEKTSRGPSSITRTIKQDRKGNIWIASWEGVIRYDGKWFTNITKKPSASAIYDFSSIGKYRFFSILEDRKGIIWFGSIGGGVFAYDGTSFQNFTIKEGLLNDDINSIYEDKKGNVWFGVSGGASRYDGKSFQNYIINGDSMKEDHTGITFSERPPFEVTSIIEDKTGKLWFASRGNTFVYDGKIFTVFKKEDGKPFTNVRCIIEDRKGNIWLGGNDGLWRYDGSTLINFTPNFTGYIYEDKKGNIWTSAENDKGSFYTKISGKKGWMLSRYNEKSLSDNAVLPDIIRANEGMIFGILEANDGNIWFGTFDGVYRYDGNTIFEFIN